MAEYINSVVTQDESISSGAVSTFDLPTNPISFIKLNVRGLNVSDEATLDEILSRLNSVQVLFRGSTIIDLSGDDLYALNVLLTGKAPRLSNQVSTDDGVRDLGLMVPLTRFPFSPNECFPEHNAGELQLRIDLDSTTSDVDNIEFTVETVELPEASPSQYLKTTALSKTPSATGTTNIDLPIANQIAKILMFSTTVPTGTSTTTTVDDLELLVNSNELNIANTTWEGMKAELMRLIGHIEPYDTSDEDEVLDQYGLLDFNPSMEESYLVDTQGASAVKLQITAGDTSEMRALPLEIVSVQS